MSDLVQFTEEDKYCLIQMDDGKANAIGFPMLEQLNAALDRAESAGKVVMRWRWERCCCYPRTTGSALRATSSSA